VAPSSGIRLTSAATLQVAGLPVVDQRFTQNSRL
jgi:hypothetical protein